MVSAPHFMLGNVAGTFTKELLILLLNLFLGDDESQNKFEIELNLSSRIYKARKDTDPESFAGIAADILVMVRELDAYKELKFDLEAWGNRFHKIATERIVDELLA